MQKVTAWKTNITSIIFVLTKEGNNTYKKLCCYIFISILLFAAIFVGSSTVHAAEKNSSTIVYDYTDIKFLTKEQKDRIVKGNPNETHANDYENYQFIYQEKSSKVAINSTDKPPGERLLLKTGDSATNISLIILGFLLVGGSVSVLFWKKGYRKQILLFLVMFGGSGLLIGPSIQAAENSNLKPQEKIVSTKGIKETKKPVPISGYNYVGYIRTVKNDNNSPTPIQQGKVVVSYQDEDGTSIAPSETLEGDFGKPYSSSVKTIARYKFMEVRGKPTGTFTKDTQTITYIYKKLPIVAAKVTVNYLNENGNQIHKPQIISGNVGDSYDASSAAYQLKIDGYTMDTAKMPKNVTGKLSEQTQEVNYVYKKKVQAVTLTIKFVDSSGNPFILPDLTTYNNGSFVPTYPNLNQYRMLLDYNQQVYYQNQVVPDIVIKGKEGEPYSLPKKMIFNILDNQGNPVRLIASSNPDGSSSGIMNWQNHSSTPTNREGVLPSENVVVTYQIETYSMATPEP
ncbi:MucBP domain-containing protein [Listeria seeligeri]|uniref:MucBP domain-containing protein n=1 Tax=Listeria seeligeri TaxID=1640 RepID=UPI001C897B43|nr:MucBP domain-containing protein [Listeria seeligeri]